MNENDDLKPTNAISAGVGLFDENAGRALQGTGWGGLLTGFLSGLADWSLLPQTFPLALKSLPVTLPISAARAWINNRAAYRDEANSFAGRDPNSSDNQNKARNVDELQEVQQTMYNFLQSDPTDATSPFAPMPLFTNKQTAAQDALNTGKPQFESSHTDVAVVDKLPGIFDVMNPSAYLQRLFYGDDATFDYGYGAGMFTRGLGSAPAMFRATTGKLGEAISKGTGLLKNFIKR